MSNLFSFNQPPVGPEDETIAKLEAKLQELRKEQEAIIERNKSINNEIMLEQAKLRNARAEKAERDRLERIRKEQEELKKAEEAKAKEIEDLARYLSELKLKTWEASHPYQKESLITTFNVYKEGKSGFFNADDMGLGKTLQAISFLEAAFKENPDANCLWLSKSSIVETGGTKREIQRWSDLKVIEILGRTPKKEREFLLEILATQKGVVILTNYETVRTTEAIKNMKFNFLVMDEVHKLKGGANPSGPTGTWKAVKDFIWERDDDGMFTKRVDFTLMLSGTPMVNRVAELWAYLHIFDPNMFPSLKAFERAFDAYVEYGGNVNTDKILDVALRGRMVRRTRKEVGLQMPELTVIKQDLEMNPRQKDVYVQMRDQFFVWLDENQEEALTATAIIAQLTRLRQIVVWPVFEQIRKDQYGFETKIPINVPDSSKVDEAMDIIEEANDQVVVFCNFNNVFDEIERRCTEMGLVCKKITGATKKDMHQYEIGFQNGEIDVLCINSSMGEGLNLQKNPNQWEGGAAFAIHLDMWWNPARDEQCDARIYRQGANQPVTIYRLHIPNSIDDFVRALSDQKAETFMGIMNDDRIRPGKEWKSVLERML